MTPARLVHDAERLNTGVWPLPDGERLTPVERFFTRSHAAVPRIDAGTWRLDVGGLVERPAQLGLAELLRALPRRELDATLVCAGMRRAEFLPLGELPGELPWGPEPASTGTWAGVALRDLLTLVGVHPQARHVEFVGLDSVERGGARFGFGGSIDLDKAMAGEVLLATELNGAALPPEHGFPLRTVVPGWIGARSVKWLGRITLGAEESTNYFQSKAYRHQRRPTPGDPRDVSAGPALTSVAVNSVIVSPADRTTVRAGPTRIRGWAIGEGGHPLVSVEVTANGQDGWIPATLLPGSSRWTWTLWEAEVELTPGVHDVVVRAADRAGHTQPASVEETWNVKGYANNAWHRIRIQAE